MKKRVSVIDGELYTPDQKRIDINEFINPKRKDWERPISYIKPSFKEYLIDTYIGRGAWGLCKSELTHRILLSDALKQHRQEMCKRYGSYHKYELNRIKKLGFTKYSEYQKEIVKSMGFMSYGEYMDTLAKKKGFKTKWYMEKENLKKRGFSKPIEYLTYIVKKNGFKDWEEYLESLAKKKDLTTGDTIVEINLPEEGDSRIINIFWNIGII